MSISFISVIVIINGRYFVRHYAKHIYIHDISPSQNFCKVRINFPILQMKKPGWEKWYMQGHASRRRPVLLATTVLSTIQNRTFPSTRNTSKLQQHPFTFLNWFMPPLEFFIRVDQIQRGLSGHRAHCGYNILMRRVTSGTVESWKVLAPGVDGPAFC